MKKCALLLLLAFSPGVLFAYGVETHARLTENAFMQYSKLRGVSTFSADDIALAAHGAVHEDEMRSGYLVSARPLNHFYDPINNRGLLLAGVTYTASPVWAIDTKEQANYGYHKLGANDSLFSGDGDHTWNRAVYEYVHGDRKRAVQSLGHVMHLLEDTTSPAHTRNDPHPGGANNDPYEDFTHELEPRVTLTQGDIPYFSKPELLIQDLALYTNTHFYSRDTINAYEYPQKSKLEYVELAGVGYGKNSESLIVQMKINRNPVTEVVKNTYSYPQSDPIILTSNWNALSKKSVAYSVALIDLFMRAVADEKETHALLNLNKSEVEIAALRDAKKLASGFIGVKSIYGSSLSFEDMEDLNRDEWNQNAAVVTAYDQLTSPYLNRVPEQVEVENISQTDPLTSEPLATESKKQDESTSEVYIPENDPRVAKTLEQTSQKIVSVPLTGEAQGGTPTEAQAPQPLMLSGGPGQGGGAPTTVQSVTSTNIPLTCTLPEILNTDNTACITPDTMSPTLSATLTGCLSLTSTDTSISCLAYTSAPIMLSWVAEDGSVVLINGTPTIDTSTPIVGDTILTAVDTAGNTTTKTIVMTAHTAPLRISEVGYSLDAPQDAVHQYIEIYNATNSTLSLDGLSLESSILVGDPPAPNFFLPLTGTIAPRSLFLITNDFDITDAAEDMTRVWTSTLTNSSTVSHQLLLKQSNTILDSFELACPQLSTTCHTTGHPFALERSTRQGDAIDYAYSLEQNNNQFVFTSGSTRFVGSPGRRNTADYVIATLSDTLPALYSPYYSSAVDVPTGATATIDAGVTLTMRGGGSINVSGTLIINGTTLEPVIIANADRWSGITVSSGASLTASHIQLSNAGIGNSGSDNAAIKNRGGTVMLTDVTMNDVQPNGFFQDDGTSMLTNVSIETQNYPENAVKVRGGSFSFTGGVLSNFSDFGFHITGTPVCTISNITITGVRNARTSGSDVLCTWGAVSHNGSPL